MIRNWNQCRKFAISLPIQLGFPYNKICVLQGLILVFLNLELSQFLLVESSLKSRLLCIQLKKGHDI